MNKLYRNDRKSHARKCSRLENLTDIFNRALDSSDPLLSSLILKERERKYKKKKFPIEVIELLADPNFQVPATFEGLMEPTLVEDEVENGDENEDENEDLNIDDKNLELNFKLDEEYEDHSV